MNIILSLIIALSFQVNLNSPEPTSNISNIVVKDIDLNEVRMSDYAGKVVLIVNVASKCGYTKQYSGLQKIYETYRDQGFEILAFPCNDFGAQEPGSNEEIKNFCSSNFDVDFALFDKIHVNGKDQSPLYKILTNNPVTGEKPIRWNFEKFIIDKEGNIVQRFGSSTKPESDEIISVIKTQLNK